MEMNYLDFVKSIEGKSIEDIDVSKILKDNIDYTSEMTAVTLTIDKLEDLRDILGDVNDTVLFYMEKSVMFFEMIEHYTTLKVNDGEDTINNYDIALEEKLKGCVFVNRYYNAIDEIMNRRKMKSIDVLYDALKQIPNEEEVKRMTENFEHLFSEDNKESLELLEDIVSFNDPSMKALKEVVYDSATNALVKAEDINNLKEDKK